MRRSLRPALAAAAAGTAILSVSSQTGFPLDQFVIDRVSTLPAEEIAKLPANNPLPCLRTFLQSRTTAVNMVKIIRDTVSIIRTKYSSVPRYSVGSASNIACKTTYPLSHDATCAPMSVTLLCQ